MPDFWHIILFPEPAFLLASTKKRSSGIIHFPETQILGSGFRAHACQLWRPKAKVRIISMGQFKLGKTETLFLKEQQHEILKPVAIEKKIVTCFAYWIKKRHGMIYNFATGPTDFSFGVVCSLCWRSFSHFIFNFSISRAKMLNRSAAICFLPFNKAANLIKF